MKILVVDDEKDMQILFLQQFRKEIKGGEIEFIFASSGEEALQYLNSGSNPQTVLILSDINMPGMSGFELLKRIKAKYKQPPPSVMMITAYHDEENQILATELGANGFLTKPLNFPELKNTLKSI